MANCRLYLSHCSIKLWFLSLKIRGCPNGKYVQYLIRLICKSFMLLYCVGCSHVGAICMQASLESPEPHNNRSAHNETCTAFQYSEGSLTLHRRINKWHKYINIYIYIYIFFMTMMVWSPDKSELHDNIPLTLLGARSLQLIIFYLLMLATLAQTV